jgi:ABC-type glycerol-3-phosphate transport system permease component
MLTGSVKSEADSVYVTPYPRFWFDDEVLFQKHCESKYNVWLGELESAWGERVGSWRNIHAPAKAEYVEEFRAWRGECPWWYLGHSGGGRLLPINARLFRQEMYERFGGDLGRYREAVKLPVDGWNAVMPPPPPPGRYPPLADPLRDAFREFALKRPVADRVLYNPDGVYSRYLLQRYTSDVAVYNREHGTSWADYDEIVLPPKVPSGKAAEDWQDFVREILPLHFIHLDAKLAANWRDYLAHQAYTDLRDLNRKYGTAFASFDEVPLTTAVPATRFQAVDWANFIQDRKRCPAEALEVVGPRQLFQEYLAARRGAARSTLDSVRLPVAAADYADCMENTSSERWEFTTRNYKHVLEYVLLHGRGIGNTLFYCLLAIITSLLVNPLAAYALSRYRPPSTFKILLFCMATMAFPGEVTMIPAFLLLKRFPLWPILLGGVAFFVALWLLGRLWSRGAELVRLTVALGIGLVVGVWLVPSLMGRPSISLLNTFAALVLPGMANGFSIFLLKGFFDSLPKELFEAAEIDGAGEWTKFWTITMSLSTPILAVIALDAFTGAYSAFMMALIIIPDPDMWTLMVWIFQLQTQSHEGVVYASLVLAAIPTFLVFVFCQNIILRGIVVPTEK